MKLRTNPDRLFVFMQRRWRLPGLFEKVAEESVRLRERQHAALGRTREQRELMLQGGDGSDGQRALDELGRMVGQAAVPHFSLTDELVQRAPRLLDRRCGIRIVELQ